MSYALKYFLALISFALWAGIASAQIPPSNITGETTTVVDIDENIQAGDLEAREPQLLPDNPFYFLKNLGRSLRLTFAFNALEKAELKLKFSSERLLELRKMIEEKKSPEKIEKGIKNYQKEIDGIKKVAEKIKQKAGKNEKVGKFLDKFIKQQILHQTILQKLENQVPPEAFEKIREARKRHLERFEDVMLKLEDREKKLKEFKEKVIEKIKKKEVPQIKGCPQLLELPPETVCVQVITFARNPETGECCEYGNPCVAPKDWLKFYSKEECQGLTGLEKPEK